MAVTRPYTPQSWETGDVITKEKLNNIEQGLAAIDTEITGARGSGSASGTLGKRIDDLIMVQDTQPTSTDNEIWIRSTGNGVQVPTMDEFDEVKSALDYETVSQVLYETDLEQNGIDATSGGNSSAQNRIKTRNAITSQPENMVIETGFEAFLYGWNGDTYIGSWHDAGFSKTSGAKVISGTFALPNYTTNGYDRFKIVIRKESNGNLTPEDGDGVVTLTKSAYSKIEDIDNNTTRLDVLEPTVNTLYTSIGTVTNLANPADLVTGSVWSSVTNVYTVSGWSRQEVSVKPGTTYTASNLATDFSWFTNDNLDNLGKITTNPFTTPAGCTKLRLGEHATSNFVVIEANQPTFPKYDDYPYGVIKTDIDGLKKQVKAIETAAELATYTSVSMFETLGAIGDSYTSGGMYNVPNVTSGGHMGVSWPQIMARRCGLDATNYSKGAIDVSGWLSDTNIGLPKLIEDAAKDLYVIVLGINAEKTIADPEINAQTGTVDDIDTSDPAQNADSFCGHYGRMISGIKSHAPNAKIILVQPIIASAEKNAAIGEIATLFDLPVFAMADDPYYATDFYTDNRYTGHPIAATYAGMALAFERQINQCIVDNISYFTSYSGD